MKKEVVVISLGGSLIAPDRLDYNFLKKFKNFIERFLKKGNYSFIIVTGGGHTARLYRDVAAKVTHVTHDDLDWLGIHATRLNAHLMRTFFRKDAYPRVITHPIRDALPTSYNVIVAGGWRPGWSTDYVAVQIAKRMKSHVLFNLSNISIVHDKDPRKYKHTKTFKDITWKQFRTIVGSRWNPGMNTPFDPVASRLAEKIGLKVIVADGNDLKNVQKWMETGKGRGTVIH